MTSSLALPNGITRTTYTQELRMALGPPIMASKLAITQSGIMLLTLSVEMSEAPTMYHQYLHLVPKNEEVARATSMMLAVLMSEIVVVFFLKCPAMKAFGGILNAHMSACMKMVEVRANYS
ncbi:hypothetical protein AMTR_s00133p00026700 [Amborella trichopoda]|uniref:Uncharacterized protein n=1 Tax=Amborella trichopoda TaxID=13333 RepID=W1P901_AMBTC|nr:hypothetical protein AMTR_s00133p00026700 [Amborella trichopoda]